MHPGSFGPLSANCQPSGQIPEEFLLAHGRTQHGPLRTSLRHSGVEGPLRPKPQGTRQASEPGQNSGPLPQRQIQLELAPWQPHATPSYVQRFAEEQELPLAGGCAGQDETARQAQPAPMNVSVQRQATAAVAVMYEHRWPALPLHAAPSKGMEDGQTEPPMHIQLPFTQAHPLAGAVKQAE